VPVVGLEPTRHRWQRILSFPINTVPSGTQAIVKKLKNRIIM